MERRITIRDIARALGYHHSTVSLALRNDARLPEKTREAVQKAAAEMGYRPDPMVQALAVYRTAVKPPSDHGTIAWLSNEKTQEFGERYTFHRYLEGAQRRARELGYRVEAFALKVPNMTPDRMAKILLARGITGIIVAPQPLGRIRARIRMDWAPFSAVTIGYSLAWPPLHMVTNHQFNTARMAFRKLISLGYRKVGLCIQQNVEERCNGGFLGGYLSESARWPEALRIPPLIYKTWSAADIRAWYRRHKPEAIIFHDADDIERGLRDMKLSVPDDVGVVSMTETSRGYAAIDQQPWDIGVAAVDYLVSMINRNERGIPVAPRRVLTEGIWRDGPSVRRINTGQFRLNKIIHS